MTEHARKDALIWIGISRKTILWGLAGIVASAAVYGVLSDTLTFTSYYPSPYGAYANLLSTSDTWLATASGSRLGVGTRTPAATLDVNGNVNINSASSPALNVTGSANVSGAATVANLTATGVVYGGQGLQMATINQSCTNANKGLIAFNTGTNGGAAQFCDGSNWQKLTAGSPSSNCITDGGVFWDTTTNLCYFPGNSCPSGYTSTGYTTTTAVTCGGGTTECYYYVNIYETPCTTGSHNMANLPTETCSWYGPTGSYGTSHRCGSLPCSASVKYRGCTPPP